MIANFRRVLGRLAAAVQGPRATGSASASRGRTLVGRTASPSHGPSSPPNGRTGPQVIGVNGASVLGGAAWPLPRLAAGSETYRRMRRDPTIALARALAVAPVVAGKWTIQADADVPQEVRGWIDKQFLTVREPLLETILKHGYVDFGHQGFELVWGLDAAGRQCIVRFKPLLPDITEILIDGHGGLAGLRQKDVELTGTSAMLVSFGGEGSTAWRLEVQGSAGGQQQGFVDRRPARLPARTAPPT